MYSNIEHLLLINKIFSLLNEIHLLKLINYNKLLQSALSFNLNSYKELAKVYRLIEKNGNGKEFDIKTNELVFEGEYKDKKRSGFGKEYFNRILIYEGEYKKGLKDGYGKNYDDENGKLIFEGKFLNGKEWEGKGKILQYDEGNGSSKRAIAYIYGEISEGKINGEGKLISIFKRKYEYDYLGNFEKGKKSGKGKEYVDLEDKKILVYEGEFKDDKRNGYGKEYRKGKIIFEGIFLEGEKWEGYGKEFNKKINNDNAEFEGEYKRGKRNGKGKEYFVIKETIKFEGNYLDGEREGEGKEYFQNGKIKFKGEFTKGKKKKGQEYNTEGEVVSEIEEGKGKGNIKIYHSNGDLEFEGEYKNFLYWNGKENIYYKNNFLQYELYYSEGHISCVKEYYDKQSYFEALFDEKGEMKSGKEYENGKIIFEGVYLPRKENNINYYFSKILENETLKYEWERWTGRAKQFYENGNLAYEVSYLEGNKHGKEIEYNEKEELLYERNYQNGAKHGLEKIYNIENNMEIEGEFSMSKKIGIFKTYKKGLLIKEIDYSSPELEGKEYNMEGKIVFEGTFNANGNKYTGNYKEYYNNGKLKLEGKYIECYIKGKVKEYYENGKTLFEGEYSYSKRYNGKIFDENGEVIDEIKEGKSMKKELDEKKRFKFEGKYLEGKFWNGKIKEYYDTDNAHIKFEGQYLNGEIMGKGKEYYENGNLKFEADYVRGEKIGKVKEYYDTGILKYEGYFYYVKHGKGKLYNEKGELIFEGEFYKDKKFNGKGKEYLDDDDDDSILEYEGEYHNGIKNGKGKMSNEKGQILFEGFFINKPFDGMESYYSEEGKLIAEAEVKNGEINGKIKKSIEGEEFDGESINDYEWNGKYKKITPDCVVEGTYKYHYFSGKEKIKKDNDEFQENIYVNGILWTGFKSDDYSNKYISKSDKLFYGEYLNGKRWKGNGKELYPDNKIKFEGDYDKGKRIKGKEYYEEGKLKFEGEYLNGKYFNGKGYSFSGEETYEIKEGKNIPEDFNKYGLRYEGEFNEERSGKGKEYFKNKLIYEGEFLEGKREGKGKEYSDNGNLKYEGEYINGEKNGKGKEYYDNGKLKYEGEYINGEKNGIGKEYDQEGNLEKEGIFYKGKIYNGKVYSPKKNSYEGEYFAGKKHGKGKEYGRGGLLFFEGEYYFNKRKKGKEYDYDGKIEFEGEYLDYEKWKGKEYKKGKLIFDGEYKRGEKWTGKIKEYDYKGDLEFEGEYLFGQKHGYGKYYYRYGKVMFEGEYLYDKEWKGKEYYYSNEELEGEYEYLYGEKNGKAIEYFKGGKLRFEGEYLNNRKWKGKGYNPKGELIYEINKGKQPEEEYDFHGELKEKRR